MASKISVECPACLAKLNIADPGKSGKKVKCPKCQEVFTPEASEDADDDLMDDFDDDGDSEPTGKLAPIQRGRGKSKVSDSGFQPAKRKASGGNANNLLIGVGAISALVLVISIGLIASGVFSNTAPPINPNQPAPDPMTAIAASPSPAPNPAPRAPSNPTPTASTIPVPSASGGISGAKSSGTISSTMTEAERVLGLRWMPADTDLFLHVKVASLLESPLIKQILEISGAGKVMETGFSDSILQPANVESISIGFSDLEGSLVRSTIDAKLAASNSPSMIPQMITSMKNELHVLAVVKTTKSLEFEEIVKSAPAAKTETLNGKNYFELSEASDAPPGFGGWMPDPNTIVLGTNKEMLASLQNGETIKPRKEFAIAEDSPQFLMTFFQRDLKKDELETLKSSGAEIPPFLLPGGNPSSKPLEKTMMFSLSMRSGIDLTLAGKFGSAEILDKFKKDLEDSRDQMKNALTFFKGKISPPLAETAELAISNMKIEQQNQIVKLSIEIPDSAQETLLKLPAVALEMLGGAQGMAKLLAPGMGSDSMSGDADSDLTFKLPGESDPIAPASVEGLPEGLKITAKSGWSFQPTVVSDGSMTVAVEILLDVKGDGLEHICAATGVTTKTVKTDSTTKLKLGKTTTPTGIDLQKTFLPYDVTDKIQMTNPPKTLRIRLIADPPAATASKIETLEGSFKIMTAGSSQEFSIDEVIVRAKRPLTEQELKAAEFKIRRSHSDVSPQYLTIWCGKDFFLGQVKGTPDQHQVFTELDKEQAVQRIYATGPKEKFSEDFQINFKLYSKLEEHQITFRFENIPLPDKNLKPKFQLPSE